MASSIRVRFAPSPTGYLHVGNVRTALYNWLYARHHGGTFIVRIEDTDQERSRPEYERQLVADLRWLGLDWDEGIDAGGKHGPYRQSERLEIYREFAHQLTETDRAYPCFCSPDELAAEREASKAAGHAAYIYSGKCRPIPRGEAERRLAAGEKAALRLRARGGSVVFDDMVFGRIERETKVIGDIVLVRRDGWPLYNFTVVIDDLLMGITHVIRGDGHISNTPDQILIYEALDKMPPRFGHLSTVLGEDGQKLSKRHGAVSIAEFRDLGYLPEALVNHLALVGWAPADGKSEILSRAELITAFSLERVNKAPGVFDRAKLNHFNRHYMKQLTLGEFAGLAVPFLEKAGYVSREGLAGTVREWLTLAVDAFRNHVDRLSDAPSAVEVIFEYDIESAARQPEIAATLCDETSRKVIETLLTELPEQEISHEAFKAAVIRVKEKTGTKGRPLFHSIRVALTARESGPELDRLVPIYESAKSLVLPQRIPGVRERLERALALAVSQSGTQKEERAKDI